MDYLKPGNEYSSYFAAAFKAGMDDSLNPCVLASILIFIICFSVFGQSKRRIFILGLLYIVAAVRMQQMIIAGFWDGLLLRPVVQWAINSVYFFIAAGFSVLGILHFRDWRTYRFSFGAKRPRLSTPAFLQTVEKKAGGSRMKNVAKITMLAIFMFFSGALFTLLGAIYPQTEYMYIVHSFWASGGDKKLVTGMFFYYSVAMVLPVMIAWAVLMLGKLFLEGRGHALVIYKGVMAALFCSGGLGLGYFVLRNVLDSLT